MEFAVMLLVMTCVPLPVVTRIYEHTSKNCGRIATEDQCKNPSNYPDRNYEFTETIDVTWRPTGCFVINKEVTYNKYSKSSKPCTENTKCLCDDNVTEMKEKLEGTCSSIATEDQCKDKSNYPTYKYKESVDVTWRPAGCFVIEGEVMFNKKSSTQKECTPRTICLCEDTVGKIYEQTSGKCTKIITEEQCKDKNSYPNLPSYIETVDVSNQPAGCFRIADEVSYNNKVDSLTECTAQTKCLCEEKDNKEETKKACTDYGSSKEECDAYPGCAFLAGACSIKVDGCTDHGSNKERCVADTANSCKFVDGACSSAGHFAVSLTLALFLALRLL